MNTTDFVLVRHGETEWHAENRYAGSSDVTLTQRGIDQARYLAYWARHTRPSLVVSSDLLRAVRTAEPAAEAAEVPLRIETGLREVHFGAAEGLTQHEMATAFPEALTRFRAAPATSPLPGAETGVQAARRGVATLHALRHDQAGAVVLVVAHSTLIRLVLCQLLGIPMDNYRRVFPTVRNVALTTVRLSHNGAALLAYNVPSPQRDK